MGIDFDPLGELLGDPFPRNSGLFRARTELGGGLFSHAIWGGRI